MTEYKAITVNRPLWVGNIAPQIKELADIVDTPGVTYESLYSYFCNTAQNAEVLSPVGMLPNMELKVVMGDNKVFGFAHWFVRGLPFISTAHMDYMYSWDKDPEVAKMLIKEFIDFGTKRNCEVFMGTPIDEKRVRYFTKTAGESGYDIKSNLKTVVFTKRG